VSIRPWKGAWGRLPRNWPRRLAELGHEVHVITDRRARPFEARRRWQDLLEPVDLGFTQLHPNVKKWRWTAVSQIADVALRYELDVVNVQYQAAAYDMRSPAINLLPWRLKGLTKTAVTFHDLRVPYLFPKAGRLRQTAVTQMAKQGARRYRHQRRRLCGADGRCANPYPANPHRQQYHHLHAQSRRTARSPRPAGPCIPVIVCWAILASSTRAKGPTRCCHALANLDEHAHLVFIGGQTGSSDPTNNQSFLGQLQALIGELGLENRVHWTGLPAGINGYPLSYMPPI
jgi:hypothetical protein